MRTLTVPPLEGTIASKVDRRRFMTGLLFGSAAAVAAVRQPRTRLDYLGDEKLDALIPKEIGRWSYVSQAGLVVPPDDSYQKSIYAQVLTRVYSDGAHPPIMLLIAQNGRQSGFLQIHRPETCYTAGGYQINALEPHPIALGEKVLEANRMDATLGGATEHVVYWTRVGDRIPPSWAWQKIDVFEQNLRGVVPDAILVRASSVDDDASRALGAIDEFVTAMVRAVPAERRRVLVV